MKMQTFVLTAAMAVVLGVFGTATRAVADAPAVVNVTSAKQVKAGDGQIAAHGTYSVAPGNILMRIDVTATKTDNPNKGQTNSVQAMPDPVVKTDWGATILVSPGTWDVTATITTMDTTTKMVTVTPGIGSVTGVVVK